MALGPLVRCVIFFLIAILTPQVYKGQFRGTPVAIKILHSQDKAAEEMFLKEADIMFKLRHPNIVNCKWPIQDEF